MTSDDLKSLFEKHEDEYLKFDRVEKKLTKRPDLHAFLLLDKLCPSDADFHGDEGTAFDMVSCARHDEFWLKVGPDQVADKISEEQIIELIRCGIRLDTDNESFAMFT